MSTNSTKSSFRKVCRLFLAIVALGVFGMYAYQIYDFRREMESRREEYSMDFLDKFEVFSSSDDGDNFLPVRAFLNKDFDGLERLAEEYITDDKDPYDGYCEIMRYFRNIGHSGGKKARKQCLENVELWLKTKPKSSVARIAKTEILINYAWDARGDGFANMVSKENFRLFFERLEKAMETLLEVPQPDRKKYPQWYTCALACARGLQVSDDQFDAIYAHAVKEAPHYVDFHFTAAHFTTPQWGGKPGEWEANLRKAISHLPERESSIVYACTIYRMIGRGHENGRAYHTTMKPAKIDVGRLIRGLNYILEKKPDSVYYNSALAHAEMEYENNPIRCRNAFEAAGWKIHLGIWQKKQMFDDRCGEWLERRYKVYNADIDEEEKETSPLRWFSK